MYLCISVFDNATDEMVFWWYPNVTGHLMEKYACFRFLKVLFPAPRFDVYAEYHGDGGGSNYSHAAGYAD